MDFLWEQPGTWLSVKYIQKLQQANHKRRFYLRKNIYYILLTSEPLSLSNNVMNTIAK